MAPRTDPMDPRLYLRRAPQQQRSLAKLELLIDATEQLLGESGFRSVTVANLKATTKVANSTIYDVVNDPRDLVAVYVLRRLNDMYAEVRRAADTVTNSSEAGAFMRSQFRHLVTLYQTDNSLRAGLSGLDSDPSYRAINLADSRRVAALIAKTVGPFTSLATAELKTRCLVLSHLAGAAAAMAADIGGRGGDKVIDAYCGLLTEPLE